MPHPDITAADVAELLSRWWFAYDEGDFPSLRALLHDEARFVSRSDSGDAPWEQYIRCDLTGGDEVTDWQRTHRLASPYPMRHFATNAHITGRDGGGVGFASSMLVTKTIDGAPHPLTAGIVTGHVTAGARHPLFRSLAVVIDFMDSLPRFPDR